MLIIKPSQIIAFQKEQLALLSHRAYPPGSPIQVSLEGKSPTPLSLEGRVLGCRRQDDVYVLKMRLINLTRPARELLSKSVA